MNYTLGIDLNRYRAGFDIPLAVKHGVRFVIAKATEIWPGTEWKDTSYDGYRNQCKANNVPFGAFMYWRAGVDPENQVDWFIEVVKKHIDLPPMIDVERYNNAGKMSLSAAADSIAECAQLLTSFYNVEPMLYTSWWAWQSLTGGDELAGELPVWVAHYTNNAQPLLPVPAKEWDIWQFTSAYPLPGQPKSCDANRYNGTEAEFNEYVKVTRSLMYPEQPPPDDGDDEVLKDIYIEFDGKKLVGQVKEV